MSNPYRDELESLRRENARLQALLAARREPRPGLALGLVVLDVIAFLLMRPWLNGSADGPFWGALALLAGIALSAVVSAFGLRVRLGYKGSR